MPPVQQRRNGLGLTAMICGIVSLPMSIFFFPIGLVLGVLGIVFGVIGIRRARRGEATNRGQAVAGLVCGILGTIISVIITIVVINAVRDCANQFNSGTSEYNQCVRDKFTNG